MDKKKSDPVVPRQNGQGQGQGVPHVPEEFDVMNPAKMDRPPADDTPPKT